MTLIPNQNVVLDFHSANSDWTGTRTVKNTREEVRFLNNSSVRIWYNEQNINFDPHWHTALEIIIPKENHYNIVVNQTSHLVCPDEIFLIPPGEMHSLLAPNVGSRFIYLFDMSLLFRLQGFSSIQSLLYQPLHITRDTYPSIYEDLYSILTQMQIEYFSKNVFAELEIYSLLIDFFIKLGKNHIHADVLFPNVRHQTQKEYVKKFNELLKYIDLHYAEDLSLEDLAANIGFSKFHFSRLFKQYTNFTFHDYLINRRLRVAEELLANSELSITEISSQAGFSSISTFNRLFKQNRNCTPSEYRTLNTHIQF